MKKRIFSVILGVFMVMGLSACGSTQESDTSEVQTPAPIQTEEKRNNAMPEIAAQVENIEQYETIFLGYPIWYADMPRIIYSFLEQYDLSGKTIIPFVTSGGSGFSNTISTIADLEPDANVVTDGFSISRTAVQDAEQEIIQWVNDLDYAK